MSSFKFDSLAPLYTKTNYNVHKSTKIINSYYIKSLRFRPCWTNESSLNAQNAALSFVLVTSALSIICTLFKPAWPSTKKYEYKCSPGAHLFPKICNFVKEGNTFCINTGLFIMDLIVILRELFIFWNVNNVINTTLEAQSILLEKYLTIMTAVYLGVEREIKVLTKTYTPSKHGGRVCG